MSFNDISSQRAPAVRQGAGGGAVKSSSTSDNLSDSLQQCQRSCATVRDKVTEMRRRKVSPGEKADLEAQIKELRDFESRLKNQLDFQIRQLENQQRTPDIAQKRIALGKLTKDLDKIKAAIQLISSEVGFITVSTEAAPAASSGMSGRVVRNGAEEVHRAEPVSAASSAGQKQAQLLQVMQGNDVDEAIAEERARDIQKMNQDLLLVNEMMRDMASIVQEQGGMITEIHTSTESSNEKAKAGLDQVKQAAAYQPTCVIS